jgi:hypothetical protein
LNQTLGVLLTILGFVGALRSVWIYIISSQKWITVKRPLKC